MDNRGGRDQTSDDVRTEEVWFLMPLPRLEVVSTHSTPFERSGRSGRGTSHGNQDSRRRRVGDEVRFTLST